MILDTNSTLLVLLLVLAAVALVLLTGAEAVAIVLTRRRIRGVTITGLPGLLRTYIRERQRLLRALRTGVTIVTAVATGSALLLVANGGALSYTAAAVTVLVVVIAVCTLRSAARIVTLSAGERWGARLDPVSRGAQSLLTPLAWILSAPAAIPLRAFGLAGSAENIDPAEELIGMLEAAEEEEGDGLIEERRMMRGVLEMSTQTVRELMTPRTDVTALSTETSFEEAARVIAHTGYSRIPLYEESLDRVVGVIYAKDLLAYGVNGKVTPRLTEIARPPYMVPETKRANELLADMRRDRVHLAVAVDEYGGIAGVITVEDLVEEIVGAITDEYDTESPEIEQVAESEAIVDAALTIDELNEFFGTEIRSEDFDTVGGLIVTMLGRLAVPGDAVIAPRPDDLEDGVDALDLRVLSILGRRIKKVHVQRYQPATEMAAQAEAV